MVVAVPLHRLQALPSCLLQTLAARHEHLEEGCRSHMEQQCSHMQWRLQMIPSTNGGCMTSCTLQFYSMAAVSMQCTSGGHF